MQYDIDYIINYSHLYNNITYTNYNYDDVVLWIGLEPDNIDKEFLRKWYASRCDPYDLEATLPDAPAALINELSRR